MTVTPFKQGEPKTFVSLLCDGYIVQGVRSMRALIDVLRELAGAHPRHRLLASLDNFPQACYTSGHACDVHDFDDTDGYDLSGIEPAAFENGEHIGYLSTKSEFFIRHGNVMRKAAGVAFADVRQRLIWDYDDLKLGFFELNARPEKALDKEIYVQIVPVTHAYEAISAFPNGYFTGDLTPMEICAVAKHLEERYGYGLFAIGASYVGFLRGRSLSAFDMHAFAADIVSIYRAAEAPDLKGRIVRVLANADFVLLGYQGG